MSKKAETSKWYDKLTVVNVRLVKEPSILSEKPIASPNDAVDLIAKLISEFDREVVCVLNLSADGTPISMNIVSIGTLTTALVSPREVMKGTILANASAFIMLHCHPSGNTRPSRDDAVVTQRMREAGELLDIEMVDHIIVACGNEKRFSFMESGYMKASNIIAKYDKDFGDRER